MVILREEFWLLGLTVLTESKEALSKAPEEALEAVLETGRAILKELFLDSSLLSVLACFDARRCGCGMLNEVFRLSVGCGSSESDSVSPSSHNAGYCCLVEVWEALRMSLGGTSSSSTGTVSVRARPVSSIINRVRGLLMISGMALRAPQFARFSGDDRRGRW